MLIEKEKYKRRIRTEEKFYLSFEKDCIEVWPIMFVFF